VINRYFHGYASFDRCCTEEIPSALFVPFFHENGANYGEMQIYEKETGRSRQATPISVYADGETIDFSGEMREILLILSSGVLDT